MGKGSVLSQTQENKLHTESSQAWNRTHTLLVAAALTTATTVSPHDTHKYINKSSYSQYDNSKLIFILKELLRVYIARVLHQYVSIEASLVKLDIGMVGG